MFHRSASDNRSSTSGIFGSIGVVSWCWVSAISGNNGQRLCYFSSAVQPAGSDTRANCYVIRCVQFLLSLLRFRLCLFFDVLVLF